MGEKLGRPLVEVTGKPRIHPNVLPTPEPVREPEKEKEKVPTAYRHIPEMAYKDTGVAIKKAAAFLGISEAQVANILLDIAQHIVDVMKFGPAKKSVASDTVPHFNPLD